MGFTANLNQIIHGRDISQDQAADMILDIFSGSVTSTQTGAFMAADAASDLHQGIQAAAKAIDSGRAIGKLTALIRFTRENI